MSDAEITNAQDYHSDNPFRVIDQALYDMHMIISNAQVDPDASPEELRRTSEGRKYLAALHTYRHYLRIKQAMLKHGRTLRLDI